MRIVLDTNVLVSAALKSQSMPGISALVVERRDRTNDKFWGWRSTDAPI